MPVCQLPRGWGSGGKVEEGGETVERELKVCKVTVYFCGSWKIILNFLAAERLT